MNVVGIIIEAVKRLDLLAALKYGKSVLDIGSSNLYGAQ